MLPTAADLDDPDAFVHHEQPDFSELDKMLGEAASGGKPDLSKPAEGTTGGDDQAPGDDKADGDK